MPLPEDPTSRPRKEGIHYNLPSPNLLLKREMEKLVAAVGEEAFSKGFRGIKLATVDQILRRPPTNQKFTADEIRSYFIEEDFFGRDYFLYFSTLPFATNVSILEGALALQQREREQTLITRARTHPRGTALLDLKPVDYEHAPAERTLILRVSTGSILSNVILATIVDIGESGCRVRCPVQAALLSGQTCSITFPITQLVRGEVDGTITDTVAEGDEMIAEIRFHKAPTEYVAQSLASYIAKITTRPAPNYASSAADFVGGFGLGKENAADPALPLVSPLLPGTQAAPRTTPPPLPTAQTSVMPFPAATEPSDDSPDSRTFIQRHITGILYAAATALGGGIIAVEIISHKEEPGLHEAAPIAPMPLAPEAAPAELKPALAKVMPTPPAEEPFFLDGEELHMIPGSLVPMPAPAPERPKETTAPVVPPPPTPPVKTIKDKCWVSYTGEGARYLTSCGTTVRRKVMPTLKLDWSTDSATITFQDGDKTCGTIIRNVQERAQRLYDAVITCTSTSDEPPRE